MSDDVASNHLDLDLVGLVSGEIRRNDALAAARHLEQCASCTDQLIDLVVAQAALRSAERVEREVGDSTLLTVRDLDSHDGSPDPIALPPLPMLDMADQEPPMGSASPRTARVLARWMAVAAVIVLGALGVWAGLAVTRSTPQSGSVVARASLIPVAAPAPAQGSVAVVATGNTRSLTVDTKHLPTPQAQGFYEVWLLDPRSNKMLPMGVLSPSGTGSYSVSASIMAGYSAVDISLQHNDGNPSHSKVSVLRAHL